MAFQRKKPAAIGIKAPYPGFIEPALATSIDKVPSGERWIHEISSMAIGCRFISPITASRSHTARQRLDKPFQEDRRRRVAHQRRIRDHRRRGGGPSANGTTDFSVLQNELKGKSTKIVMVAFDLLYLNGYDLRKLPLFERKALLKKNIDGTDVQFSESFEVDGDEMFEHACKTGFEGVISKVRDSRYPTGRSNDWVKKTCAQRETLTIAGYALDGSKWDGLYLGRREGSDLIYAGKVDHDFDRDSTKELQARLKPLVRKTQPYSKHIAHRDIWVEPSLMAEIEYRAKSAERARLHYRNNVSGFSVVLPRQELFAVPPLEPKSHRIIVC